MRVAFFIFVVVIAILQYRFWFADDGIVYAWRLKKAMHGQQVKNDELAKHNASLGEEIKSLKKGGEAIENRARNDLGMVKKGEVFYQVVN